MTYPLWGKNSWEIKIAVPHATLARTAMDANTNAPDSLFSPISLPAKAIDVTYITEPPHPTRIAAQRQREVSASTTKEAAPKLKDFIYSCGLEMVMTRGHLKSLTCIKPRAKLKKFASSTSPYRVRFGDSSESLRLISSKLSYGRALPAICFRRNKDHN